MFPISRAWILIALIAGMALAGCVANDNGNDQPDEPAPPSERPPAAPAPPPQGTRLGASDIAALIVTFDEQPFHGGQGSPEHVWKWVTDETFIGLHFNHAQPALADALLWIVVGQKGVFCAEAQPGGGPASGFTHFHKWDSPTWESGHGGDAGDQGYWLLHLGVDTFSAPAWDVEPGTDYGFMPTPPEPCGDDVPAVDFEPEGAGPLSSTDIATLNAVFDEQPFAGGQETPEHVWKWVNEEVFIFLHYNHEHPQQASGLNWYGLGVRGEFCREAQPHADFTHFHQWDSPTWEGAHGGSARDQGYWLLHAGVHEFSAPAWDVDVGVDRNFMPTPVPSC